MFFFSGPLPVNIAQANTIVSSTTVTININRHPDPLVNVFDGYNLTLTSLGKKLKFHSRRVYHTSEANCLKF